MVYYQRTVAGLKVALGPSYPHTSDYIRHYPRLKEDIRRPGAFERIDEEKTVEADKDDEDETGGKRYLEDNDSKTDTM